MSIPVEEWRWLGYPQHLIVAQSCRFRLATVVGDRLISTVGDYHLCGSEGMTAVGAEVDSFFETMVFPVEGNAACGCCPHVTDWCGIEMRRYADAIGAERGHVETCRKYASEES
jgi:hypothetical protein